MQLGTAMEQPSLFDYLHPRSDKYKRAHQKPNSYQFDMRPPLCQYRAMVGETKNQFSLTRATPSTSGHAKSKFLSAKVKSCCSEGESPSGLAESRRSLERKN